MSELLILALPVPSRGVSRSTDRHAYRLTDAR
jgi:hypothetical protein